MRKRLSVGTTSGVKASEFLIAGANELRASCRAWAFIAFFAGACESPLYQRNDAVPATFSSSPRRWTGILGEPANRISCSAGEYLI
jgi:hypothetical protein